jgi:hypothetical protein
MTSFSGKRGMKMQETPVFLQKVLILTWDINRNVEISEKVYTILPA